MILECGLQQVEMAHAIPELQYEVALSGYRQSRVSSALKHLITRPSYTKERKDMLRRIFQKLCGQFCVDTAVDLAKILITCRERNDSIVYIGLHLNVQ